MGDNCKAGEYDVDVDGPRQCDVACFSGACSALPFRRVEAAWSTYGGTLPEELQHPLGCREFGVSTYLSSGIYLLIPHCSYSQNSIGAWSKSLPRFGRWQVTTSLQPRSLRFATLSAERRLHVTFHPCPGFRMCHPLTSNYSPSRPQALVAPCHWLQESRAQESFFRLKVAEWPRGPCQHLLSN